MSDHSELKRLAEAAKNDVNGHNGKFGATVFWHKHKFSEACTPDAVLALIAEIESLRKDRTDWQAECLKLGFEYVRAPDDHYVLADVPEMARLLAQLLGVEVRDKENDSYGETISELHEQVEAGNNAFHRAYEAETECDRLKEEVEALIKRCDRYAQDPSGSKIAAIYAAAHGHLLDIHIIDKSGKSQALDAVFALRKDAERYRWLRNGSDYSVSVHEGPELDKLIDRAMSEAAKQ